MAGETHSIFAINIGSTLLGGISDVSAESGLVDGGKAANGQIYRYFASIRNAKPVLQFTTLHVLEALGELSLAGVNLSSKNLKFYGQEKALTGGRTSSYKSFTAAYGLLYPTRLSCRTNDDATLACEAMILTDPTGVNDPLVYGTSTPVGLPLTTAHDNKRYTLGTTTIAGVSVTNITNIDIDFGVTATKADMDSSIFPKFAAIESIQPKITIDVLDITLLSSAKFPIWSGAAPTAKSATHANTSIQLRKRKEDGGFDSSGHCTLTTAGLCYITTIAKGSDQGDMSGQIVIEARHDGTNAPIKWS